MVLSMGLYCETLERHMVAVNAHLGGKLRPLDDCSFSLLPVMAGAGAEPSMTLLQAYLLHLGQPVLLEHSDC